MSEVDLHAIVREHAERLNDHDDRLDDAEERLDDHDRIFSELKKNMTENQKSLARIEASGATKDDINVILRDALNAVPEKQATTQTYAIMFISALALLLTAAAFYFHK